ncbi:MAG: MaoC/PaaZ C-terminal domain-containing protein [Woeseiaceae bacterium]|nr:MaoC/PaaZ C-terminal domain-containing protein [Woeseiaceae bacterium]
MALNYEKLMATSYSDIDYIYSDRETMMYALSIGLGRDPLNEAELAYVYEQRGQLKTVPTMSSVLVQDLFGPDLGWDYGQVLHIEQRMSLYRPLPPEGRLKIDKYVKAAYDLGARRGAIVMFEAEARLAADDTALFTIGSTVMARGDGGFGGPRGSSPSPHRPPRRDADLSCELPTRLDQPLWYRLNDDRNPLHADPAVAGAAGFERPIMHGLCTYGIACHAVLKTICDYDYTLIEGFDARFSAPVMPGDTIRTDMWQDGNVVSFLCKAVERDVIVLKNGKCTIRS